MIVVALGAQQQATAQTSDYIPPKVDTTTPTGVNIADGSFIHTQTDLSLGQLSLNRFYLGGAEDPNRPFFGPKMDHTFDIYVAKNFQPSGSYYNYKPVIHMGTASAGPYLEKNGVSSWPPQDGDGYSGELTKSGTAYVYTAQDGTRYTFNPSVQAANVVSGSAGSQRVASIAYPNGRTQSFSYNASGQLKLVSDSTGYAIVFDYNADQTVSAACGFNLAVNYVSAASACSSATFKVSYGYTGGKLTSVTDVRGQTTSYQYSATGHLSCITPPGFLSCQVTNEYSAFMVEKQTMADGAVWQYSHLGVDADTRNPDPPSPYNGNISASITDPAGKVSSYIFTQTSPYQRTDANGHVWQYRYSGGGVDPIAGLPLSEGSMLVEMTSPEGNKYTAQYFGPHNSVTKQTWTPKPGSGLADSVIEYGYAPSCASPATRLNCTRPLWKKDPKGNQADYSYTATGDLASEMDPAPSAGAARPLKLFTYAQKYAWVKDSGGSLVPAVAPVWLPSTETLCQTYSGSSAATCDPAAPIMVTTYEYGADGTADNLRPRGVVVSSSGVNRRTCYGYDWKGNKIWETSPRAGLSVCQ
ncbi:RHS repeat protein [Sphingomonas sp. 7/4-4]|uniref:RHS repeat domain-containing protein n=1 Tax=Sphingomonas sp. 7/4-4 TaxID=3018446 RepID=UPI0022F3D007|nr:RHS repeat domain-containing protein [Sphingomonas sp. 7/4-4]WBY08320.1 RHS repeat protein [Sphingomonas sp. 7/4-4]